jgi:hypothetical protein
VPVGASPAMPDQYGDGWLRMTARLTILPSRMLK